MIELLAGQAEWYEWEVTDVWQSDTICIILSLLSLSVSSVLTSLLSPLSSLLSPLQSWPAVQLQSSNDLLQWCHVMSYQTSNRAPSLPLPRHPHTSQLTTQPGDSIISTLHILAITTITTIHSVPLSYIQFTVSSVFPDSDSCSCVETLAVVVGAGSPLTDDIVLTVKHKQGTREWNTPGWPGWQSTHSSLLSAERREESRNNSMWWPRLDVLMTESLLFE